MAFCLLTGFGKQKLIHNDVVRVDFVGGQFLYKTLRLVQRQEFGYAHANERRLLLNGGDDRHLYERNKKTKQKTVEGASPPRTHTGSLNWVFTSVITARIDSSFENMSSVASA